MAARERWEAGENRNVLLELSAADLNGDGADDIIVGWGHGSAERQVFVSSSGQFFVERSFRLPTSVYGVDNQLSLDTFPYDYDLDGDVDLVLLWSRFNPFYGGDYLQILRNDGDNNFVDVTTDAMLASNPFNSRLGWNEHWTLIDANKDGHMDIAGQIAGGRPYLLINTGATEFGFRPSVLPWDISFDRVLSWGDFTGDGKLNFVAFRQTQDGRAGPSVNEFGLFSVEGVENISSSPAPICSGPEPCYPAVGGSQCRLGKRLEVQVQIKAPQIEEPEPSGYEVWCSSASTPQSSVVATANFIGDGKDTIIGLDTSQLGSTPYECYAEAWNSAGYSSDADKGVFPATSHKFNVELELQSKAGSPPQLFEQLLRMVRREEATSDC